MSFSKFSSDSILIFYKILNISSSKCSSLIDSIDSSPDVLSIESDFDDSSDYNFMCTMASSNEVSSVIQVLKLLDFSHDPSRFDMYFSIIVPLNDFFPYLKDLGSLSQLSDSFRSSKKTNNYKRNRGHPYSKNHNHSFELGIDQVKTGPLVWVPVNLKDNLRVIESRVFLKIYVFNKENDDICNIKSNFMDDISTNKLHSSTLSNDDSQDIFSDFFVEMKSKPESYDSINLSDRDDIIKSVKEWSLTNDGKLKDIRSLLSTLQNILWSNSGWDPMPFSLLVGTKESIKKYYKKSLLICHPDKQNTNCIKRKLLCELILESLIKSWNSSF